jgi:hypothetical protein
MNFQQKKKQKKLPRAQKCSTFTFSDSLKKNNFY